MYFDLTKVKGNLSDYYKSYFIIKSVKISFNYLYYSRLVYYYEYLTFNFQNNFSIILPIVIKIYKYYFKYLCLCFSENSQYLNFILKYSIALFFNTNNFNPYHSQFIFIKLNLTNFFINYYIFFFHLFECINSFAIIFSFINLKLVYYLHLYIHLNFILICLNHVKK